MIDSLAAVVQQAQERHFTKWQILGENVGAPEVGNQPLTYAGEVQKLKNWVETRLSWLDNNMTGSCTTTGISGSVNEPACRIFPNPVSHVLTIMSDTEIVKTELFNLSGERILISTSSGNRIIKLDVSSLPPGVYAVMVYN